MARLALIGAALAAVAATFAYLGGWFTPNELTPARLTDGFEQVFGVHPSFRRNHAKGLGASGFFESNGEGVRLSKATVFRPGTVPVIGRFSFAGGLPYIADKPDTVRGLGASVSPARRRTVAHRDDQLAGVFRQDPRGVLRTGSCVEARPSSVAAG